VERDEEGVLVEPAGVLGAERLQLAGPAAVPLPLLLEEVLEGDAQGASLQGADPGPEDGGRGAQVLHLVALRG
jgi:hypothetical protein